MADLGVSPLANSFLTVDDLTKMERFYPLKVLVCDKCFLAQLEEYETPQQIFGDYAYFSSYSTSWLAHADAYVNRMVTELNLGPNSLVVEVASNDGYLLQYLVARGVPVIGVEPAENVAAVARERGVPTITAYFGRKLASDLAKKGRADLIVANNVLAHVPDLNDFVAGLALLLRPDGLLTVEVPHLLRLIEERQFDTIYHEHFSYFSLRTARSIFAAHGMSVVEVDELETHGGSLRLHVRLGADLPSSARIDVILARELAAGLDRPDTYSRFAEGVRSDKRAILAFFVAAKDSGARIAGYGAPAKGNTLLNYCGMGRDFLDFTVDASPHKQGLYLPGTHIPIKAPEAIRVARPDLVFILPWNLRAEIGDELAYVRDWGGRLVVARPRVETA